MSEIPQYYITENGVVDNRVIVGKALRLVYRLAAESTNPDEVHRILQEFQGSVSGDERGWIAVTALWVGIVDILGELMKTASPDMAAGISASWRNTAETVTVDE